MPRVRVQLNHAGMAELLNDDGVRGMLTARMQPVLSQAVATAPVASGEHRASGHIEQVTTDRAAVRVVFDSDHSLLVEARTGHIARALVAAGGEAGTVSYTSQAGKASRVSHRQRRNYRRKGR